MDIVMVKGSITLAGLIVVWCLFMVGMVVAMAYTIGWWQGKDPPLEEPPPLPDELDPNNPEHQAMWAKWMEYFRRDRPPPQLPWLRRWWEGR